MWRPSPRRWNGKVPDYEWPEGARHLYAHDQVLQVFLTVYGFAAGGLVLLELFGVGYWIGFLEQYGGQLFLAVLVYSGYVLWDHCRRNLHV